jgi:hypothetical protein
MGGPGVLAFTPGAEMAIAETAAMATRVRWPLRLMVLVMSSFLSRVLFMTSATVSVHRGRVNLS